jgi:hypothetical protein
LIAVDIVIVLKPAHTFRFLAALFLLALAGCGTLEVEVATPAVQVAVSTATKTPPVIVTPTPTEFVPLATDLPTPTQASEGETPDSNTIACPELNCVWMLDHEPPELVSFEGQVETVYDYSPATQRLLHGRFTGRGAGPGNIAVSDLQFMELYSGLSRQIIPEENIAEAVWAPNGQNLAYVKATSSTYELHWLTEFGEDRLLARDVAFTFSISPNGDRIAFTRESNYNVAGQPGLFILDISSGEEWSISEVDREGTGSISDRPIWSMDGGQIILPVTGRFSPFGFVRAAADGSSDTFLAISPSVQEKFGRGSLGTNLLWHPDNRHLIGQVFSDMFGSEPRRIFSFELDDALERIVSADLIYEGEGELVGWAEPGASIWIRRQYNDLILAPLP